MATPFWPAWSVTGSAPPARHLEAEMDQPRHVDVLLELGPGSATGTPAVSYASSQFR